MSDLLPILSGLIVISALAIVASNDKEDKKKEPRVYRDYKKPAEAKKKDDDVVKKLLKFYKSSRSSRHRPKRHFKVRDSKGRTLKNKEGWSYRIVKPISV